MAVHSLIIIGGGPGGNAAALEASRRGIRTTLIESAQIGGTCLNRGCIPSKYFLARAFENSTTDMRDLSADKNNVVATVRQRMEQALKKQSVTRIEGTGKLLSPHSVEVTRPGSAPEKMEADAIFLATGTLPIRPAAFPKHAVILDSTSALELTEVPKTLLVLGGGYIGCELAFAFQGLGSKVTLVEKESRLLPTQPEFEAAGPLLEKSFESRGVSVWLGTTIDKVEAVDSKRLKVLCSNGKSIEVDGLLLAIGRKPNVASLGLDAAGLAADRAPKVNEFMQTQVASIYAIGDLVSPLPLAHVAAKEGEIAVAHMAGEKPEALRYSDIPRCVYTFPEAAAVGLTQEQAREAGFSPRVDRYHFAASAKALVEKAAEGFWMIVSDTGSGKILGGQIVGPHATELIHLISLSLKAGLRAADIADTVFAHPTLSEGFQEAMSRAVKSQTTVPGR